MSDHKEKPTSEMTFAERLAIIDDLENWTEVYKRAGAYWMHDRENFEMPFALLTSGLISDFFFNADCLTRWPSIVARSAGFLLKKPSLAAALAYLEEGLDAPLQGEDALPTNFPFVPHTRITRVVGAAHGATTLAHEVARHLNCQLAIATVDKTEDTKVVSLDRFRRDFKDGDVILLVEDTVSTGGTLRLLRKEVQRCANVRIVPCVLSYCNRMNSRILDGLAVTSLVSPLCSMWERGHNPFTPDHKEIVEPVRPKLNWHRLVA